MPDRDRAVDVEAADAALERKVSGSTSRSRSTAAGSPTSPGDPRHAAPARLRRLPPDRGRDRCRGRCPLCGERSERVRRPGHRLPARRRAVGEAAGAAPRRRPSTSQSADRGDTEIFEEVGEAGRGTDPAEVVIAVGPAFGDAIRETINGLDHGDVLAAVVDGVSRRGRTPRDQGATGRRRRVHRPRRRPLSGSGVALGLQSKGTAVIHRADLQPLDNLELFGMSPLYSLESYRAMGRNAAGYALGPAWSGADRPRQLRAGEGDRAHHPATCDRGPCCRARSCARRAGARTPRRRAVGSRPCDAFFCQLLRSSVPWCSSRAVGEATAEQRQQRIGDLGGRLGRRILQRRKLVDDDPDAAARASSLGRTSRQRGAGGDRPRRTTSPSRSTASARPILRTGAPRRRRAKDLTTKLQGRVARISARRARTTRTSRPRSRRRSSATRSPRASRISRRPRRSSRATTPSWARR